MGEMGQVQRYAVLALRTCILIHGVVLQKAFPTCLPQP